MPTAAVTALKNGLSLLSEQLGQEGTITRGGTVIFSGSMVLGSPSVRDVLSGEGGTWEPGSVQVTLDAAAGDYTPATGDMVTVSGQNFIVLSFTLNALTGAAQLKCSAPLAVNA